MSDNRGGQRQGAGRQPGPLSLTVADSALASPYQLRADDPRLTLSAPQRACITLRARGRKYAEIGRRLSIDPETAKAWCERFPEALEAELAELKGPGEFVRPLLPLGYDALRDCLEGDGEPAVKLAAAREVFDRYFGKPIVHAAVEARADIRILFVDATDDGPYG